MVLKQGERAAIERVAKAAAAGARPAIQIADVRRRIETTNQLALKADITVTDALDARIDTAETNIISQAAVDVDHEGRIATLESAPAPALDDLTDVDTTGKADGEVLTWVAADSAWKSEPAGAGSAIEVLDEGVSETAALASLDFVGPVTAVDDGSGNVTVTVSDKIVFRGASVHMTSDDTAQNLTGGINISFDAAAFDTDGFWSAGAPQRITIPPGLGIDYVEVFGQVMISSSTASTWKNIAINHFNSANVMQSSRGLKNADFGSGSVMVPVPTGPVAVNDSDYFVLAATEESDASVTIQGNGTVNYTFMSIRVIGTS
jgi:hypothetical protein